MRLPRDERETIRRARSGDRDAYRAILEMHGTIAFRTAYLITGSAPDAEEVVQDAYVKAFRALPRFRDGAPLRPWLLTIVANEARNRRRANEARPALPLIEAEAAAANAPEAGALSSERRRMLGRALARLPDGDRDVLACRFFLDLPERERAAVLGWRVGTVKSRTSRALARLREVLEGRDV